MDKPKNHTIAHSLVMALMIVLMGIFISGLVSSAKDYYINTHANFVQEYATIVRYEAVKIRYHEGYTYTTYYEYEADDGWRYSGIFQRLIKDEEEAKAQVGKKVRIYVDHTLHHHATTLNFSGSAIWFAGSIAFVCCLVFLNSAIRETIYIVKWVKYKKSEDKKQTDIE